MCNHEPEYSGDRCYTTTISADTLPSALLRRAFEIGRSFRAMAALHALRICAGRLRFRSHRFRAFYMLAVTDAGGLGFGRFRAGFTSVAGIGCGGAEEKTDRKKES